MDVCAGRDRVPVWFHTNEQESHNAKMFQEFSIARLEDEVARERRDVSYHQSCMQDAERDGYDSESERQYDWITEHSDMLHSIEEELKKRYTKVREVIETEHLADLSVEVLSSKLDESWWNMRTITNEFPQKPYYYERYNAEDIRSTALMMLLIQKRIAATQ